MTSTARIQSYHATSRAGDGLALRLMLVSLTNSIAMSLIPIVNNELRDTFRLSPGNIGLLTSVFMLAFGIGSIPAGVAVARWGGRTVLVGVGFFVAGSVLFALSSTYGGFLAGRLLQGLGGATFIPVANHLFTHRLPPERQARALGIFGSGHGMGIVAALLIMPSVQSAGGHRAVFLVAAAISAVIGAITATDALIRSKPDKGGEQVTFVRTFREFGKVAVNSRLLLLVVINIGVMAVVVGILAWTPNFLQDQRGSSLAVAAYLTAGVGVASILGNIAGAAAMHRWGKPFVLLSAMAVMLVATALTPVLPGAGLAIASVIVAGFMSMVLFPAILGSVPDIVPQARQVGAASGFLNLTNLVGTFLSPWIFGLLLSQYGRSSGHGGYLAGYLWLALFPFVGTIAGVAYMRARRRDTRLIRSRASDELSRL